MGFSKSSIPSSLVIRIGSPLFGLMFKVECIIYLMPWSSLSFGPPSCSSKSSLSSTFESSTDPRLFLKSLKFWVYDFCREEDFGAGYINSLLLTLTSSYSSCLSFNTKSFSVSTIIKITGSLAILFSNDVLVSIGSSPASSYSESWSKTRLFCSSPCADDVGSIVS